MLFGFMAHKRGDFPTSRPELSNPKFIGLKEKTILGR
jgi:hypothetical protein